MGGNAPDLLRVPFQAAMSEPQIRAGDDGLDQTPPPLVAGSLQLLGVGHRQEAVAETTDENAFFRWKGIGGSGRAGLEGSEGGERRVLEKSSLERPIRGERRRWWPHGTHGAAENYGGPSFCEASKRNILTQNNLVDTDDPMTPHATLPHWLVVHSSFHKQVATCSLFAIGR